MEDHDERLVAAASGGGDRAADCKEAHRALRRASEVVHPKKIGFCFAG
jgi:hypothetical protein